MTKAEQRELAAQIDALARELGEEGSDVSQGAPRFEMAEWLYTLSARCFAIRTAILEMDATE
jgi:hypothetical protein